MTGSGGEDRPSATGDAWSSGAAPSGRVIPADEEFAIIRWLLIDAATTPGVARRLSIAPWKNGFSLFVIVSHQAHHRGQVRVLMRQAGLSVVGIYGPTREEWASMNMPAMA